MPAHKQRDEELLEQRTVIKLRDGGSRVAFCEKRCSISVMPIVVLGVWHPVVFPDMKPRILFYSVDTTVLVSEFLLFKIAACFSFCTKGVIRLNQYKSMLSGKKHSWFQ